LDIGDNPYGEGFMTSMDWLHGMNEGLGKHLIKFLCTLMRKWKILTPVDASLKKLNRKTSHPQFHFKNLNKGLSNLDKIDALHVPGVLMQISIVLGHKPPGHTFSTGSSEGALTTRRFQSLQDMISLFLRLDRHKRVKKKSRKDIWVSVAKC